MNTITTAFLVAFEQACQQLNLNESDIQYVASIVNERAYHFHFIHRDHQAYGEVRTYRRIILEKMGLAQNSPAIQIIGDSARFGEDRIDFARNCLFNVLNKHPEHLVLYGITGKSGDVNALVSEWIANNPTAQARSIGNAVSTHTSLAIKSWGCDVGNISNVAVVYPDALFGDDIALSDNFVPQYDDAPGASMGICLEGGVQSFLQAINMLHLNIPVLVVEKLRGPNNAACKIGDNYVLFFSAAEFLSLIKNHVQQARLESREVTHEEIEQIRSAYLYNPEVHGIYNFTEHGHLRLFANPNRHDYGTKMDLFVKAFDKFFNDCIWEKLSLLSVVNCEKELEKQALKESISAMIAMRQGVASAPSSPKKVELHSGFVMS